MLRQPLRPRALAPLLLLVAGCAQPPLVLPPGEAVVPAVASSDYRLAPTAIGRTRPPRATPAPIPASGAPALGPNASLGGRGVFAASSAWNQAIDQAAVDANSNALIASIGVAGGLHADFGANWNGGPFGIPYVVVDAHQPRVPMVFDCADESDAGPYPVPPDAPIEGGASASGDRHVLVIERDSWKLYELFDAHPNGAGWKAGSGATFDLNTDAARPAGWTSADAAGLPIFPGLVRYDEVGEQQVIRHALRFTVAHSRKAYVPPASHFASSNTSLALPPMGMRVRLKASFDHSAFPPQARVVLQALKTYGMIVADNGSNWYISGAPDARWNDDALNTLKSVKGGSFEVVQMGRVTAP
jgi:hypothetical protein